MHITSQESILKTKAGKFEALYLSAIAGPGAHFDSFFLPTSRLEFVLYDIYRILRPGGLFWLDHFFCTKDQLKIYVPMIEQLGYKKLKLSVAPKLDRGPELKEMYIYTVLEKPLKRQCAGYL